MIAHPYPPRRCLFLTETKTAQAWNGHLVEFTAVTSASLLADTVALVTSDAGRQRPQ